MFKGLNFFASGRDMELHSALNFVEKNGGCIVSFLGNNLYSARTIHALIIGKIGANDVKIAHAIENGIPVVSYSWIIACEDSGSLLEFGKHRSLRTSVNSNYRSPRNHSDQYDPRSEDNIRRDLFANEKWIEIMGPDIKKNTKQANIFRSPERCTKSSARIPDVYVDPNWESSLRKGSSGSMKKREPWMPTSWKGGITEPPKVHRTLKDFTSRHHTSSRMGLTEEGLPFSSADHLHFSPIIEKVGQKKTLKPTISSNRRVPQFSIDDIHEQASKNILPIERLSIGHDSEVHKKPELQYRKIAESRNLHSLNSSKSGLHKPLVNKNDRSSLFDVVKNHPEGKILDKEMIEQVLQQVITSDQSHPVTFADISGLENCKQAITESIILPFHRPELFTGLRKPSSALLLFGPPGNGKTMLAQAIACECNSTFFSLSASSLISKFVGDSEKAVKALFTVAHILAPSILFFDEIDALLQSRGGSTELEGSRRLKTEFLIRVDGVKSKIMGDSSIEDRVVVIGATNRPFDLDDAVLRRFPKKIFVPLPALKTRLKILRDLFSVKHDKIPNAQNKASVKIQMNESEWNSLAERTEGYSSSDLSSLCKEIALVPIRELNLQEAMQIGENDLREIVFKDAKKCLHSIKPSTSNTLLKKLEEWNIQFGSS